MRKIGVALCCTVWFLSSCGVKKIFQPQVQTQSKQPARSNPAASGSKYTAESYIERFKSIAVAEMNTNGIPASITLAQGLLESGNGNSDLALRANNHFGIKCNIDWKGQSILKDDDQKDECFRVYNTPEESYKDHSEFLKRKRYAALFELAKNDYKGWALGLKAAGYATNPQYPDLLISLIERYHLYLFDAKDYAADRVKREERVLTEIAKQLPEEKKTEVLKTPVSMKIYEVKDGDTLFAIAKRFGLSVDELRSINNIQNDVVNLGQLLVVSK